MQVKIYFRYCWRWRFIRRNKKLGKGERFNNVIFHGRKTGKPLIEIYKNSDAFILTSNEEAFPLTILEAMASKLPVIASDVKGNHDVVKGVGILVNPPTPRKFAKEIDRLFSNKICIINCLNSH